MKLIYIIWLSFYLLFAGCKSTKLVTKEVIKYDSTAIKESAAIKRVLKEELDRFEKEKEGWNNTGIAFVTEPCPDTTKKIITKIVFDKGKLKSVEGNIKILNQSIYEKSAELLDANYTIDSLILEVEKKKTEVIKENVIVEKKVKTKVYPIWLWLVCIAGGMFLEFKFNVIKRSIIIFSSLNI